MRAHLVVPLFLLFAFAIASLDETRNKFAILMNMHGLTHFSEKTNFIERAISSRVYAGEWDLMELGSVLLRCLKEYDNYASLGMQSATLNKLTSDAFILDLDRLVDQLNMAEKKAEL